MLFNFDKVPSPSSITLVSSDHSSRPNFLPILGSDVTLTCTLELNSAVVASEILLLMVDTQLYRDGTPLALTEPTIRDTTFTYTTQINSFGRSDSGSYTCTATVGPELALTYVTGNETLSAIVNIKAGIYIAINCYVKIKGFVTLNLFMLLMIDLNFFSSFCTPCRCPSHSVWFLCPSGGQLESSI